MLPLGPESKIYTQNFPINHPFCICHSVHYDFYQVLVMEILKYVR